MSSTYTPGAYVHAIKRGGRGMPIVKDEADRHRFLQCLYFLNDRTHPTPWERDVQKMHPGLHFQRPPTWSGKREQMVEIYAFCLLENHFHLLMRELKDGGVSEFMQSLSGSMTHHFNRKYDQTGSIFQGPPKYRMIENDSYFVNAQLYITVKNSMEKQSDGLEGVHDKFEKMYELSCNDPFCSLADNVGHRDSPIVVQRAINTYPAEEYKEMARDFIRGAAYRYEI